MTHTTTALVTEAIATIAARRWNASTQVKFVERTAVVNLVLAWASETDPAANVPDRAVAVMTASDVLGRANQVLAMLAGVDRDGEKTAHGTPFAVLYAPITEAGLQGLIAWLGTQPELGNFLPSSARIQRDVAREVGPYFVSDADVQAMHYRQAAILMPVPAEQRGAVVAHAHFRMNVSGGILSSNLQLAVSALAQAGSPEALMAQDQADNERLMRLDRVR